MKTESNEVEVRERLKRAAQTTKRMAERGICCLPLGGACSPEAAAAARESIRRAGIAALALLLAVLALAAPAAAAEASFGAEAAAFGCHNAGAIPTIGAQPVVRALGSFNPAAALDFIALETRGDRTTWVQRYGFDPTGQSGLIGHRWSDDALAAWMQARGHAGYVPTRTDREDADTLMCGSRPAWDALGVTTRSPDSPADDSCCSPTDNRWGCEPYPAEVIQWCAEHVGRCRTIPTGSCPAACVYDLNSWFQRRSVTLVDSARCRGEVPPPPPPPAPEPVPVPPPPPASGQCPSWVLVMGPDWTLTLASGPAVPCPPGESP